jgi:PAS domain S-box-containing protein
MGNATRAENNLPPGPDMSRQQWLALKDRALAVAAEGVTIADARAAGKPLVYVNDGFERLTGYASEEVLGHNCRFLQGPDSDPEAVATIRRALRDERGCTVEILNYRKDGTPFWNRLSITPMHDAAGELTHFIGIQSDVTERRLAEEALRRANEELARVNGAMQRDLAEAAEIQRSWLPRSLPEAPGLHFAWSFKPCRELGGDSLNVLRLDRDRVGVYVLDVCGHGVGAALLSASIQRWLSPAPENSCLFTREPGEDGACVPARPADVIAELNRRFRAEPESGKFFTLLYGVLDLRELEFRYATAGHPPPLRTGPGGSGECPAALGVPVGVVEGFAYEEARLQLRPGDRLLLFSDGAPETLDADDNPYGTERLLLDLERLRGQPAEAALATMMDGLRAWSAAAILDDDVTLLAIDVLGV